MITESLIQTFIEKAKDVLEGDWLILGGSLIPLIDKNYRSTMDIDVVRLGGASNEDTLKLMSLAEEIGLPVEAINMAAAFFVNKIKNPERKVIELFRSKRLRLLRPNFYFYLELKSARLSETDASDILRYLSYTIDQKEDFERQASCDLLEEQLNKDTNPERNKRRKKIIKALVRLK